MLGKVSAFVIRDFLEEMSYPLTFVMRWGGILFKLLTFYFLGKLVGEAVLPQLAPYGNSYFPFVMIGLALASFQSVALTAISRNILYGMYTGTLGSHAGDPYLPVHHRIFFHALPIFYGLV
jgi:hypothetical protein